MNESRLIDLEIRLTHQEATLETLNETIIRQQAHIDRLTAEIDALKKRLRESAPAAVIPLEQETPPPHY